MLESFAVNICVNTAGNDYYDQVAINKDPIIIFGRESDVRNVLSSQDVIDYIKAHIRSREIYEKATYHIVYMTRDNQVNKFTKPVQELTKIEWEQ